MDHIDGNIRNAAVINLRILPDWLNARDGGFIRKLRNQGIDPTMFAQAVLMEYFERMAEYKAGHSVSEYANLTRTDLLQLLVGPKFTVSDPAKIMEEDFTRHLQ